MGIFTWRYNANSYYLAILTVEVLCDFPVHFMNK
jgi:hypothetical protein